MDAPRYNRPAERPTTEVAREEIIPPERHEEAIANSDLSTGSKDLLRGLMRLGAATVFQGGGVGLEYAGLLKSAVRPDIVGEHVREAAQILQNHHIDLLLVPGMSGYPIGTMYAVEARVPGLLLRKEPLRDRELERTLPPGAFILPSYTSRDEVLMSADPAALVAITDEIFERQAAATTADVIALQLRVAGADDIIDKATMARATSESAHRLAAYALERFRSSWRSRTGDERPMHVSVEVVTWVTPMLKAYNDPEAQMQGMLTSPMFAGLRITGISTHPRAVGIEGIGVLGFSPTMNLA